MKKILCSMVITFFVAFFFFNAFFTFAGGYESPYPQDQMVQEPIYSPQNSNNHNTTMQQKHYYLEMAIGGGTLLLGAAGLWLKYRKKELKK